jgi:DNA modification methylase
MSAELSPPPFTTERRPLSVLIGYARNSRTHSPEQVAQLAASIREWGFTIPILIDEHDTILAGHGRLAAAQKLELADVPVIVARGWSDAQKHAYVIADNKLAMNAGWDMAMLATELRDLALGDFDMTNIGFEGDELAALLGDAQRSLGDPEATPEPPAVPVAAQGDVWLMGKHRLICGDATVATVVAAVLGGAKPHLMVTDPPYGVEYDAEWRARAGINAMHGPAHGKVLNDDRVDWRDAWALFDGDVAYVWHASWYTSSVQASLEAAGFEIRNSIIWAKQQFAFGRGHYHWQHEPCWYAVRNRQGATGHWQGDHTQTTLWQIDKPHKSETGHSTQKPIECMRKPIENNSAPGDSVYDPFSGSGTTIIACEVMKRRCLGIELNPAYIDVAVERWQTFTNLAATLEGDGRSFAEVKAERTSVGEYA